MHDESPTEFFTEPRSPMVQFEEIRRLVESQFGVEEGFVEHGIPTFYVQLREDSKEAFLRLLDQLEPIGFIATLRKRDDKTVVRIVGKPEVKRSRPMVNWALFFATIGTVLFAGYLQSTELSNPLAGAIMFAGAIMGILGSHEMGHKLLADSRHVEATYPYFIPGPPPLGTFGAVIQQKSLPPNRDSLFDMGIAGPVIGFLFAIVITVLGIPLSNFVWISPGDPTLGTPMLFLLIEQFFPPGGPIPPPPPLTQVNPVLAVQLHPVAFAGWVGMVITMLNLIPAGMLDGGHAARSFLGDRTRTVLAFIAVGFLFLVGLWVWALIAFFFALYRHPGPLDDVSPTTTARKLAAIALLIVFIICIPLPPEFYDLLPL
jgi:membrane-associated protease RseP (regulator of RpoE activity)